MTKETLSNYIKELYKMIKNNNKFGESRIVFGKKAVDIGNKIFNEYGADGMFDTMRILCDTILYNESVHQSEYLTDLRELECKWSGITDDFQC
jgi:hypothetical protein